MVSRSLSFGQDKKLRSAAEFSHVREKGEIYRGNLVHIGVVGDAQTADFRAGFITSRRIGNAVQRNRLRRRLREIVRKHQTELRKNIWFVTIARAAAARATYSVLEDEWLRLAKRASILARS